MHTVVDHYCRTDKQCWVRGDWWYWFREICESILCTASWNYYGFNTIKTFYCCITSITVHGLSVYVVSTILSWIVMKPYVIQGTVAYKKQWSYRNMCVRYRNYRISEICTKYTNKCHAAAFSPITRVTLTAVLRLPVRCHYHYCSRQGLTSPFFWFKSLTI